MSGQGDRKKTVAIAIGVAVALVVAGVLVVSRSGVEDAPKVGTVGTNVDSTSATTTTTTTEPLVPVYPLTGLPITDAAKAGRVALVIKIDNANALARPQVGINQADIVFEEKVEGPISRFAAIYHSLDVEEVGPVRSGRSTDVAIVSALNHPLYAFSGANTEFVKLLRAAPLVYIGQDIHPEVYDRKKGREAPDNVFTSTDRLRTLTPEGAQPPLQQLSYRRANDALSTGAISVASFGYDFGLGPVGQPVTFTWDLARKGWLRTQKGTPHVDAADVQIAPPNVIVQLVPYRDTGFFDTSRTPVPEALLVGTGDAWVFTNGHAIKASWAKPTDDAVTSYTTADGTPIGLTPGTTWIALVPTGGGNFNATMPDGTALPVG